LYFIRFQYLGDSVEKVSKKACATKNVSTSGRSDEMKGDMMVLFPDMLEEDLQKCLQSR